MELTKKDLEQVLDQRLSKVATKDDLKSFATRDDLKVFATKDDLQKSLSNLEKKIITRIDGAQEELAVMTKNGFDEVLARPDYTERIKALEKEMMSLKTALSLT